VLINPQNPSQFAQQLRSGGSTPFALTNVMTETRTYVGLTGTPAFDGMAGFRIGQRYELNYTKEFDEVRITIPHGSPGAGPLVVTVEQFEKWFVK
jgi:hypothetical protein